MQIEGGSLGRQSSPSFLGLHIAGSGNSRASTIACRRLGNTHGTLGGLIDCHFETLDRLTGRSSAEPLPPRPEPGPCLAACSFPLRSRCRCCRGSLALGTAAAPSHRTLASNPLVLRIVVWAFSGKPRHLSIACMCCVACYSLLPLWVRSLVACSHRASLLPACSNCPWWHNFVPVYSP